MNGSCTPTSSGAAAAGNEAPPLRAAPCSGRGRASRADFREAMAHLPAAVNIITTDGPAGRCGLTVSAVCSVTDTPPTVLVCVNQESGTHDVFERNGRVCVNVLGAEQRPLALHFAGATQATMDERFAWDIWEDAAGVPLLRDAPVGLVGTVAQRVPHGSHTVMFLEVEQVRYAPGSDSLVYYNRDFHRVA